MSISQVPLSRRRFIVGAGALVIGAYLPSTGALARSAAPIASGAAALDANAFVQIGADGVVTVISKHTDHEPKAPFGGFKQSGLGREMGKWGMQAYLEAKTLLVG